MEFINLLKGMVTATVLSVSGLPAAAQELPWKFSSGYVPINIQEFTTEEFAMLALQLGVEDQQIEAFYPFPEDDDDNPFSGARAKQDFLKDLRSRAAETFPNARLNNTMLYYDFTDVVLMDINVQKLKISLCVGGKGFAGIEGDAQATGKLPVGDQLYFAAFEMMVPGSAGKILRGYSCKQRIPDQVAGDDGWYFTYGAVVDIRPTSSAKAEELYDRTNGFTDMQAAGICGSIRQVHAQGRMAPSINCMQSEIVFRKKSTGEHLFTMSVNGNPGDLVFR